MLIDGPVEKLVDAHAVGTAVVAAVYGGRAHLPPSLREQSMWRCPVSI